MNKRGFTIVEVLIVTTIMGLIVGISVPNLFQARRASVAASERQYAISVYKAANAYFSGEINATRVPVGAESCLGSYAIGDFSVAKAPSSLTACTVILVDGMAQVSYSGVHSSATIQ